GTRSRVPLPTSYTPYTIGLHNRSGDDGGEEERHRKGSEGEFTCRRSEHEFVNCASREGFLRGTSNKAPACSGVISHAWRMGARYLHWRRSNGSRRRWTCRCTASSIRARSRHPRPI